MQSESSVVTELRIINVMFTITLSPAGPNLSFRQKELITSPHRRWKACTFWSSAVLKHYPEWCYWGPGFGTWLKTWEQNKGKSEVNTCGGLLEKCLPEARLFEDLVHSWCRCVRWGDYGMFRSLVGRREAPVGGLWEFTASPHFRFILSASCVLLRSDRPASCPSCSLPRPPAVVSSEPSEP